MNARSIYSTTHTITQVDRRGVSREIIYKRGRNKGKTYPYRGKKRGG